MQQGVLSVASYQETLTKRTNMMVYLKAKVSAGKSSEFLLRIGDGVCSKEKLTIPACLSTVVMILANLTAMIYSDITTITEQSLTGRAVLPFRPPRTTKLQSLMKYNLTLSKRQK